MTFRLPQEIENIFSIFEVAGYELYLVGGAVRDYIMGKDINDWDFTTNATPQEIQSLFPDSYYNNRFGTVGIPSTEFKPHEITTFRTESSYTDSRHPEQVTWGETIEEDLTRRDFTINAIALSFKNKTIEFIDPFYGRTDMKKKIIRAVGDPTERFGEDSLRLLRAVRIASELNFTIESDTFEAIKSHAPTIHNISAERIKTELMRIMASDHPYEGVVLLKETGLMQEILPEMEKTFGVEQKSPGRHHIYDVGTHSILSLKFCKSTDPLVRFATLIHDIGKPQTYRKDKDTGLITFYNHEVLGARIAKNIAKRLRFSRDETDRLFKLVRWHQFTVDETQTDKAIRRFIRNVGQENIGDMLDLRVGDRLGGGARETSWRLEEFKERLIEVQKEPFSIKDLKITGHDIMDELHIEPSPQIGKILHDIFQKVEDKKLNNDRDSLIGYVLSQYKNN